MNKKESRYFSTAAKMDEALLDLLENKDFEYITIKEICAKAGVNRSTFYLHYENTRDLLTETTRYVVDKFLSYFIDENKTPTFSPEKCELRELIFVRSEYILPYLTYIKENRRIFNTSLNQFGVMGFEDYYNKMFKHIFNPILERFDVAEEKRQYVIKYYLTGVTAIVMEWLKNECLDPIDKIYEIIVECSSKELWSKQTTN